MSETLPEVASGATFRALVSPDEPRAKALGYCLKPLRGTIDLSPFTFHVSPSDSRHDLQHPAVHKIGRSH